MQGGKGDDTYCVNHARDEVIEIAGNGRDTVIASASYALGRGEAVEFMRAGAPGSTLAINLTGNERANTLQGNAAANRLDGGDGADVMQGYRGNDTYVVDHGLDRVIDDAGRDTIVTAVSYELNAGCGVEILRANGASGTVAINLTGNRLANTLQGNAAANRLDGGRAADLMQGYRGDDTYVVDHVADKVIEVRGAGQDTIITSVSYELAAGSSVELIRTANPGGTAAINLTGNHVANTLQGNAGANVIDGGAGSDTLLGLGGKDIFRFDTALGRSNVDSILDYSVANDTIYLDDAVFTALQAGPLRADVFEVGATATGAHSHIVYSSQTGALIYDADGSDGGAAYRFATLSPGLALSHLDFVVI